jgi:hypothetical protein
LFEQKSTTINMEIPSRCVSNAAGEKPQIAGMRNKDDHGTEPGQSSHGIDASTSAGEPERLKP